MTDKEKFEKFCKEVYVPVYSKPWWMDAICGSDNWNVWLYENGEEVTAALPYYMEKRGERRYITKPPLTQNNGLIFKYPRGAKQIRKQAYEEEVIEAACDMIRNLKVDVYEQQYHYSFRNWLPFYWNQFTETTRYTYVMEDLQSLDEIWNNISSNYRNKIRKGQRLCEIQEGFDKDRFYLEHEKIFFKQGLKCPFDYYLWSKLYDSCREHEAGKILFAVDKDDHICSLSFLVWDEQSAYHILGGNMPEFQNYDTYSALIWSEIQLASAKHLKFDFEGSMIKRIAKSFREFGATPKPYFRIRKVFSTRIQLEEVYKQIESGKKGV